MLRDKKENPESCHNILIYSTYSSRSPLIAFLLLYHFFPVFVKYIFQLGVAKEMIIRIRMVHLVYYLLISLREEMS